ncbi:hypothetical protein CF326_g5693 [Tilletia indica]|nr:hypothetical protein CF326_g5693 [Tilletia indica]
MPLTEITNTDASRSPTPSRSRPRDIEGDDHESRGSNHGTSKRRCSQRLSAHGATSITHPLVPTFNLEAPIEEQIDVLLELVRDHRKDPDFTPGPWQLEAALKVLHGWDGIIGAATGSGKSLVWELVALAIASQRQTVLVVCPLVALESDQAQKYAGSKLRAVSVSAVTGACETVVGGDRKSSLLARSKFVQAQLIDTFSNLVFASPEAILKNPATQSVLQNPRFKSRLRFIVVDEAHIIKTWGLTPSARSSLPFRPAFSEIQTLRARLGSHLPLLAVSATLSKATVRAIIPLLNFGAKNTFAISAGADRTNISYALLPLQHSVSEFKDLLALFCIPPESSQSIPKTLIYVRSSDACSGIQSGVDVAHCIYKTR